MPIKSWDTDLRIPRFGMIRLGEKGPKGNPIALDYFVVPDEVKKVYGEKPKELDILLPSENLEEVLSAWYKRYGKNTGIICRGDEETALLSLYHVVTRPKDYAIRLTQDGRCFDAEDRELPIEEIGGTRWVRIPCNPKICPFAARNGETLPSCRPIAILNFLLPEVPGAIGVYSIATSSRRSYQNILAGITLIRNRLGYISDIPLKLRVSMVKCHPIVEGKKITTEKPVLDIRLAVSLKEALELSRERRLQLTNRVNIPFEPVDESVPPETFYQFPEDEEAAQGTEAQEQEPYTAPELPDEPYAEGDSDNAEDVVLPPDYDDEGYETGSPEAESPQTASEEPAPEQVEKPAEPDHKDTPQKNGGNNDKPASDAQIRFIKSLASKRLDPDKPETWPPLFKKLRESGSLTSSEASNLITDLKLMPPLNLEATKSGQKTEQAPECKAEEKPQEAPESKPAFHVAEGEPITFLVVGMPKTVSASNILALAAKAKVEGSDAIWEISWDSSEPIQVRPNGYKYQATVVKVKADARKAFVKDLKVQQ